MNNALEDFCKKKGICEPFALTPIRSGRNSAVYCIDSSPKKIILKHYFRHESDPRNRLAAEFNFLKFLKKFKIEVVAKPIAFDEEKQLALYSYLEGSRPLLIKDSFINQAAKFALTLNELSHLSKPFEVTKIGWAADACPDFARHINSVENRLMQFENQLPQDLTPVHSDLKNWLINNLYPKWAKVRDKVLKSNLAFSKQSLTLSPSDYGFHNTIEFQDKLQFIDFEYAGWDSTIKLVCDFICQPELPIDDDHARRFVTLIADGSHDPNLIQQVSELLPVHRIKWCCILLNEFKHIDQLRRTHAGSKSIDLLNYQLNKSKLYFKKYL